MTRRKSRRKDEYGTKKGKEDEKENKSAGRGRKEDGPQAGEA